MASTSQAIDSDTFDVVPLELREVPRWVCWRYETKADGKETKVPYKVASGRIRASSTDPETWTTFAAAVAFCNAQSWIDGIGVIVTDDDDLVGVDLDGCLNGDDLATWARSIVKKLNSYTEVSPSGHGLRVFVRGKLPPGRRQKDFEGDHVGIGLYETGRFLTVTGNNVTRVSTVVERTTELAEIHRELFGDPKPTTNGVVHYRKPLEIADAELLARARAAGNGDRFWTLWSGDLGDHSSASEADSALVTHLLWWTGGNPGRTDALFRQSGLMRPKWDTRRGSSTYGQITIENALSVMTDFYEPFVSTSRPIRLHVRPGEDAPAEGEPLPMTDYGNAQRLVERYGHSLRYCHPWNKWLAWDGARWRMDDTGAVWRCAKRTVRAIFQEAADASNQDLSKALGKHAVRSQAEARLSAMINLAESEPSIPVLPDHLDADPWLLCLQNGVLDLQTGELGPHDRELLLTKVAPVSYDPDAECPQWVAFLNQILAGNRSLIAFVQRAIGYSLTGSTRERVLFLPYGTGSNGKSTLIETIRTLLGDYAQRTPTETLIAKRENSIPNDVARLRGARFVSAVETEEGKRLAEALVKDLTGGDTIAARFMRGEWFDFKPSFKLWLGTNHKPVIRGTDNAIWNRIRLLPFTVTIPEHEQDKELPNKLRAELPGILTWAVRGCLDWQRYGLGLPDEVRSATDSYRAEQDVIAGFLQDSCIIDRQASVTAKALYEAYKRWCDDTGEYTSSQRRVGTSLTERGFVRVHVEAGWRWNGLRLAGIGEHSKLAADPLLTDPQVQNDPTDPDSYINTKKNTSRSAIPESGSDQAEGSAGLPW